MTTGGEDAGNGGSGTQQRAHADQSGGRGVEFLAQGPEPSDAEIEVGRGEHDLAIVGERASQLVTKLPVDAGRQRAIEPCGVHQPPRTP